MRVKPAQLKPRDCVYYFSPRKYVGYQDKWLRKFSGSYEVIKTLGPVNVVLLETPRSVPFTTHIDKVKLFTTGPNSDFVSEQHQRDTVLPRDVENDVTSTVDVSMETLETLYKSAKKYLKRGLVIVWSHEMKIPTSE